MKYSDSYIAIHQKLSASQAKKQIEKVIEARFIEKDNRAIRIGFAFESIEVADEVEAWLNQYGYKMYYTSMGGWMISFY